MVRFLVLLLAMPLGCATSLAKLVPEQRQEICQFLSARTQQGDFLGCFLAAQRAAASRADYGRAIHPEVSVDVTMVYDRYGYPTAMRGLTTSLPQDVAPPVLACFRDALMGAALPPQDSAVRVPITMVLDALEPPGQSGVSDPSTRCLLGPSGSLE